ncbi:YncE family protein [Nocardia sp. NPDC004151]|uniref:YncE family protein n=1 Tax=Nocardia sp. NPDC004151 TaxID=3364304 RepID=UPI0036CBEEA0
MTGIGVSGLAAGIAPAPAGSRIAVIDFGSAALTVALLTVSADGSTRVIDSRDLPPVSAADLTESGLPPVVSAAVDVLRGAGITSPDDIHALYLAGAAAHNPLVQQAFRPLCADQRVKQTVPQPVPFAGPAPASPVGRRNSSSNLSLIIFAVLVVIVVAVGVVVAMGGGRRAAPDYPAVSVGREAGAKQGVVDSAAGRLYVADDMAKSVAVVDTANRTVVSTISFQDEIVGIALDPELHRLYVESQGDRGHADSTIRAVLWVVDTTTNGVVATIETGAEGRGVAVDPGTHRVYVTNERFLGYQLDPKTVNINAAATLSVIDPRSAAVVASFEFGTSAGEVVIDPATRVAYVAGSRYDQVRGSENGVIVVDLASNQVAGQITVPDAGLLRIAADLTANTLVLVGSDAIRLADTVTRTVDATLRVVGASGSIGVDPVRHVAYVADNGRDGYQLLIVELAERRLSDASIETGMKSLVGSAVDPRSRAVYAFVAGTVMFVPPPQ